MNELKPGQIIKVDRKCLEEDIDEICGLFVLLYESTVVEHSWVVERLYNSNERFVLFDDDFEPVV